MVSWVRDEVSVVPQRRLSDVPELRQSLPDDVGDAEKRKVHSEVVVQILE